MFKNFVTSPFASSRQEILNKNVSARIQVNACICRVLRMEMILPTFAKTKVGRTEG